MATDVAANMRATTEKFLYSWNGDWKHSAEPNLAARAPECIHNMLPASIGAPPQTNDQWAHYFKNVAPLVTAGKMVINDYLASNEERRVVCRSSMSATTPAGPFNNEYVWFFWFNETGDQIVRIDEFLDSKVTADMREKWTASGLIPKH